MNVSIVFTGGLQRSGADDPRHAKRVAQWDALVKSKREALEKEQGLASASVEIKVAPDGEEAEVRVTRVAEEVSHWSIREEA